MSETESRSTSHASGEKSASGGMSPLRIILLVVLALMIVALVYDWYVARPASDAAYQKVMAMVEESASRSAEEGQYERADVQEALGKQPSKEVDGGHYLMEEYHWVRGLPFRSYYITVVYNKKGGGDVLTLANVEQNQPMEDLAKPGGPVEIKPGATGDDEPPVSDPAQSEGALDAAPSEDDADLSPPVDTPAEESPTAEETPTAEESPAVEEEPVEDDAPLPDAAAAEESTAEESAGDESAADDSAGEEAPADPSAP